MMNATNWVTVKTAAPALDMTEDQIYRAIRENKFPFKFVKIGKLIRIHAEDVGLVQRPGPQRDAEAAIEQPIAA